MGRKLRKFSTGEIYHIIQRGHNKSYVFDDHHDKSIFMKIVKEVMTDYPCHLLYYVLMGNHYHFVVEMQSTPISTIMQRINLKYSKYYNKKYQRSGTTYGERFKSYLVKDLAYLKQLIIYLANNPVKAGIVKRIGDYPWSAHHEIVTKKYGIVMKNRLFEIIGQSIKKGITAYYELIKNMKTTDVKNSKSDHPTLDEAKKSLHHLFLQTLGWKIDAVRIRLGCRVPLLVQMRREFVRVASIFGHKMADIADVLQVTERCAHRHLNFQPVG